MHVLKRVALTLALILGLAGLAQAQVVSASQAGLDAANAELQGLYDRLRPVLEAQLLAQAQAELAAVSHTQGALEVSVKRAGPVTADLRAAPGFKALSTQRLEVAVPHGGAWKVEAEAEVRVKVKVWFARLTLDLPVRLTVDGIQATTSAALDDSDPTRPKVQRVDTPVVSFRTHLSSSKWYYDLLLRLLNPIGERLAKSAVADALNTLAPSLAGLIGLPGPVPGAGAAALVDSGAATPFREVVANVDLKTRRDHVPHGTILEAMMDVPAHTTWIDAYRNGGAGNAGRIVRYDDGGDSAIWTGHYLGSQALRYAVTGEAAALSNVQHAVWGIGNLLDVNGGTGLLARVAAPEQSLMGQEIVNRFGTYGRATLGGKTWVWRQGGNGISRDQYSGVFFGLALAHDLVPAARVECARRIQQMLDYIIGHDWFVDEDRRAFDGTPQSSFPTFWAGVAYQRLTFLQIGERAVPGRYAAELRRASPLSSTAWLGSWLGTFNLDSYYKFNLTHTTQFNYFRLETDQSRWQDMARAFAITRRYTGHHGNAHFDLVQASADPSLQAAKYSTVRETLRRFLDRTHRHVGPAVVDLSAVRWVTYASTSVTLPGSPTAPQQVTLPSEPLPVGIRHPEANFLWQRSPFRPAAPGGGDPTKETPGTDLLLPYWMARHLGAL